MKASSKQEHKGKAKAGVAARLGGVSENSCGNSEVARWRASGGSKKEHSVDGKLSANGAGAGRQCVRCAPRQTVASPISSSTLLSPPHHDHLTPIRTPYSLTHSLSRIQRRKHTYPSAFTLSLSKHNTHSTRHTPCKPLAGFPSTSPAFSLLLLSLSLTSHTMAEALAPRRRMEHHHQHVARDVRRAVERRHEDMRERNALEPRLGPGFFDPKPSPVQPTPAPGGSAGTGGNGNGNGGGNGNGNGNGGAGGAGNDEEDDEPTAAPSKTKKDLLGDVIDSIRE